MSPRKFDSWAHARRARFVMVQAPALCRLMVWKRSMVSLDMPGRAMVLLFIV